jgi:hypothetical protein
MREQSKVPKARKKRLPKHSNPLTSYMFKNTLIMITW